MAMEELASEGNWNNLDGVTSALVVRERGSGQ
jgi:hypothetical protein